MPPILNQAISDAISRDATVLTPNQRVSRVLRQAWEQSLLNQERADPELRRAAEFVPLEAWMSARWSDLLAAGHSSRVLLNRAQENAVWLRILERSSVVSGLIRKDGMADLAARAWRLLHLYGGLAQLAQHSHTLDAESFLVWSREFRQQLAASGHITAAELAGALATALANGHLELPPAGLALVDFNVLPPAQAALFTAIEQAGYPVVRVRIQAAEARVFQYQAASDTEEIDAAAAWIRLAREAHPTARLALVVPGLAARRAELDRLLHATLASEQTLPRASASLPYEFSLGTPLLATDLAASALLLLRWQVEPLTLEPISALLLSPFFGAADGVLSDEAQAVATYDAYRLRERRTLRPELTAAEFLNLLREDNVLSPLRTRLQAMLRAAAQGGLAPARPGAAEIRQSYTGWAAAFRAALAAAGWTAAATHGGSAAYQAHARWESLLDELCTLDFEPAAVTAATALADLRRMAAEAIFAPESENAPIQILGPLEVGGEMFDGLWFLGADDLNWPAPANTHPLLPYTLQQAQQMPGTQLAAEQEAAAALTARIAGSATQAVFSYARHTEDAERRPSSLIATFPHLELAIVVEEQPPVPLELHSDTIPLPVFTGPVGGGARVLQLQAACGFRAFAELRLHSNEPGERQFGLDARDRGEIVHAVMEHFWARVKSQEALRKLSAEAQRQMLQKAIGEGLERVTELVRSDWDEHYLAVEYERLERLLLPWLAVEAARPEFTLAGQEREVRNFPLGPLTLNLRVDRLDETGDGYLVLDYKTGEAKPSGWLSERPEAPQLPLYATVLDNVAGVAFAQLRAGKNLCLTGFAESDAVLARTAKMEEPTFAEQVAAWRRILKQLAENFSAGDAAVLPKSFPQTCEHCTQRVLCRVQPARLTAFDDADEEAPLG